MSKYLSLSLIIVAFVLGLCFGYYLTPEYSNLKSVASHSEGLGNPDKYLNLRYINGMIAHHQSAIYMLEQVKKETKRQELLDLADAIIKMDTKGIEDLYILKKQMYEDNRKISQFNKINLGAYDENFDLRFLNAMIIHHDEAIKTSKEALGKSFDNNILNTANTVIKILGDNEKQLLIWREDWYKIK